MEAPDFWDDAEKASADMKELKDLKSIVERADALSMAYDDIMTLIEMGNEEADESLVPEVENEFVQFQKEFEDLRITTMLTGEHDAASNHLPAKCRISIHQGLPDVRHDHAADYQFGGIHDVLYQ